MKEGILSVIALAVAIAIAWFGGEYFEIAVKWRIAAILVLLGLWFFLYVVQRALAIRSSMLIEKRLRAQAKAQIASARPVEREAVNELEQRLNEAIAALKKSKLGKSALYDLPWYIFIGPPGSGKSTCLQKSGLDFPQLNQSLNGIRGVGGTRNCEWWFTSESILLDTAGRYTTEEEDREEWLGFLDMIKDTRSRTPINGAIVAISLPDLLNASETELAGHAKAVRDRLTELAQKLEVVFPYYILFTKCDLLEGFVDFFEEFSKDQRAQVWGHTFSYNDRPADKYKEAFVRETSEMYERLCERRLTSLATDRTLDKQEKLFNFPLQFALARERLAEFFELVNRSDPLVENPVLRGFYFTSGTQEGTPINQVLAAMKEAFGEKSAAETAAHSGEKKAYFINHLFTKVIFPDRNLARSSVAAERRRRLARVAGFAATALMTVVALGTLINSYLGNAALIERVETQAAAVLETEQSKPKDVEANLAALDELRAAVAQLDDYERNSTPLGLRWGLYQGANLERPARQLYFRRLKSLLVDPAVAGLATELNELGQSSTKEQTEALKKRYGAKHEQELYDGLYRLLRAYLMLTGRLEGDEVELGKLMRKHNRWLRGLGAGFGDAAPKGEAAAAADHQLTFFLTQLDRPAEFQGEANDELIQEVKRKLEANFWISQSYTQIRDARVDQQGKAGLDTLFKTSGQQAFVDAVDVSQVFSKEEWTNNFEKAVKEKSSYLAEQYKNLESPKEEAQIEKELTQQYLDDAQNAWGRFLDELHVKPCPKVADAVARLQVFGDPELTPLPHLFNDVWPRQHVFEAEGWQAKLEAHNASNLSKPAADKPDEERRTWLQDAQRAIKALHGVYTEMAGKGEAGARFWPMAQKPAGLNELDPLKAAYLKARTVLMEGVVPRVHPQQQGLAKRLFQELLDQTGGAIRNEAQAEADGAWKSGFQEPFAKECAGRYPFVEAQDEVDRVDFQQLFNRVDGALWKLMEAIDRLGEYQLQGARLIKVSDDVRELVRVSKRIREALYPPDRKDLSVASKVKLIKRSKVRNVRLIMGETKLTQNELPPGQRPVVTWGKGQGATLMILPTESEEWVRLDFPTTDWALSRMLDKGKLNEGFTERKFRYTWTFDFKGQERLADIEFELDREASQPLFKRALFVGWPKVPTEVGK